MNYYSLVIALILYFISKNCQSECRRQKRQIVFPDEGKCRTPNNGWGNCVSLPNCRRLSSIRNVRYLRRYICDYDHQEAPLVCCPEANRVTSRPQTRVTTTRRQNRRQSTTRPRKPSALPKDCGRSSFVGTRIVGGSNSEPGTWPWLAAIFVTQSGVSRGTDCAGALVSNRHVVTAAHCFVNTRSGTTLDASSFTVRLGEYNLNDNSDGASPVDFRIEKINPHENFDRLTFKNDIAVLKLQGTVQYNKLISPICLPYDVFRRSDLTGRNAFVMGWGTTGYNGNFNPEVSEIQIPIWSNEECRRAYRREIRITEEYICAGVADGTKDACQGDSGGPLVSPTRGRYYLVGIVSFGKLCATPGYPGVYTRLSIYLNWIANKMV